MGPEAAHEAGKGDALAVADFEQQNGLIFEDTRTLDFVKEAFEQVQAIRAAEEGKMWLVGAYIGG